MSIFGIDYAWSRPSTASMKEAGVKFACRYLSYDETGKNLSIVERDRLIGAGIAVVLVWETTASRALSGFDGGASDAREANRQARVLGMPASRPIYFAVDWDAGEAQQARINAYLDGVASVIGRDRVGVYAGYWPLKRALDAGKAKFGWQTYAWSGGRWDSRAQLQQYSNGRSMGGQNVDFNRAMDADYGQWGVGPEEENMPLTQADADLVVETLLKKTYNGRGDQVGLALQALKDNIEPTKAALAQLLARDPDVDEAEVARQVLAVLTPEAIVAHLPEDMADRVLDGLAERLGRPAPAA